MRLHLRVLGILVAAAVALGLLLGSGGGYGKVLVLVIPYFAAAHVVASTLLYLVTGSRVAENEYRVLVAHVGSPALLFLVMQADIALNHALGHRTDASDERTLRACVTVHDWWWTDEPAGAVMFLDVEGGAETARMTAVRLVGTTDTLEQLTLPSVPARGNRRVLEVALTGKRIPTPNWRERDGEVVFQCATGEVAFKSWSNSPPMPAGRYAETFQQGDHLFNNGRALRLTRVLPAPRLK